VEPVAVERVAVERSLAERSLVERAVGAPPAPKAAIAAAVCDLPAPATPRSGPSRASVVVLVLGCVALVASAGLYWLAPSHQATAPTAGAEATPQAVAIAPPAPSEASVSEATVAAATPAPVAAPAPVAVVTPIEPATLGPVIRDKAEPPVAPQPPIAPRDAPPAVAAPPQLAEAKPAPEPTSQVAPPQPVPPSAPQQNDIAAIPAAEPPAAAPDAAAPEASAAEAPAPPDSAPVAALSPEEVGALLQRGDELLATGDIAASRLFYQRAAEQGSGPAATAVGKTFDPLFLEQLHARGIRGDAVTAAGWYRKAASAGDRQGQIRLERLLQRFPE
jgi:hypothetical protein